MKIENPYTAKATCDLMKNDPVVIVNGECRRATWKDKSRYHVIDDFVKKNQIANLAGEDTVFHI